MDERTIIIDEYEYRISLNEVNGIVRYQHYQNSSYMDFYWWDTNSVLKLLIKRLDTHINKIVNTDCKLKRIPSHNNLYRENVLHFVHIACPRLLEYLESNEYKKLGKKDFNRKTLEKCNINYLLHLYEKIK